MHGLNRRPTATQDDWEDVPADGWAAQWLLGVAVPVALAAYSAWCAVSGDAWLPGRGGGMRLHGGNAVALGGAALGIAAFLHCHYFWGNIYHLSFGATLGKIGGLALMIASLGYLLIRVGIYGR